MFAIYAQHVKIKFLGNPTNCDCHLAWRPGVRDNRHLLEKIHLKCTNETFLQDLDHEGFTSCGEFLYSFMALTFNELKF